MKRERTGVECENKETHWVDDILCCFLWASFPRLRLDAACDFARLQTLQLVSRQFARLVLTVVVANLQRCHQAVFASMTSQWKARLTGLCVLEAQPSLPTLDFSPYTRLRQLHVTHCDNDALRLPASLCELHVATWIPRTISLGRHLTCLRKLVLTSGSQLVTLGNLPALTALEDLVLGRACLARLCDLTALRSLRSLSLSCNAQLRDSDVARLTQLRSLDLSHNKCITDDGISGLTGLCELNLMRNDRISEAALYALSQLETLVLHGNVSIGCGPLLRMPHLRRLGYQHCITIVPREFARMTQLTALDLYNAMQVLQSLEWTVALPHLRELCITTNERVMSRWVTTMSGLTCLKLSHRTTVTKRARMLFDERGGRLYRINRYGVIRRVDKEGEEEDDAS